MDPPTPHDALVKSVFGDPAHAAGELQHLLPTSIAALLNWSTLTALPGSFIDEALRQTHSDILFEIQCRGTQKEVLIYLLFEHQSTDRPMMALVLLRYVVRVWDKHLARHPEADKIPAIVPMVLHHSEKGWKSSTTLARWFGRSRHDHGRRRRRDGQARRGSRRRKRRQGWGQRRLRLPRGQLRARAGPARGDGAPRADWGPPPEEGWPPARRRAVVSSGRDAGAVFQAITP